VKQGIRKVGFSRQQQWPFTLGRYSVGDIDLSTNYRKQRLDEAGVHFKLESEKIPGRAAVIHNFPLLALKKLKKPLNMFGHREKIQRLAFILWREATSARINLNA
jgi:hypothetical protein